MNRLPQPGDWVTVVVITSDLWAADGQRRTALIRTPTTLDRLAERWLWRVGLVVAMGTVPRRPELTSYRVLLPQGEGWGTPELLPEELAATDPPEDWRRYVEYWQRIQRLRRREEESGE